MRITYLHQYFNTPSMSGGTRSFEMARRLVAKGHEVNMITSWCVADGRDEWFTTEESGIRVHWLPVPYSNHMSYANRIKAFFRFAFLSARRAASIDGDLVFATSTPLTIALPAVYAARKQRKPMVFEVRDLWPELPIAMGAIRSPLATAAAKMLERWAYRNSQAVVALSPGMRDGVVKTGYAANRVAVIPNSSDTGMFEVDLSEGRRIRDARPWLGDRPLLLYPGTFGKINGVEYLVDVASRLKDSAPEIRILLVGDGSEKPAATEKARDAGVLGVNLFIEDPLPKKEMPALFSAADMVCSLFLDMPEMRANSANKFFDTLAASKPSLLNYGGWQADLVRASGAGLVTWQMPVEAAADAIVCHLQDKAWLQQAGEKAHQLAGDFFNRDDLARQLSSVLEFAHQKRGADVRSVAPGDYHLPTRVGAIGAAGTSRLMSA
jgi:glycosyltransferase involved in cell wall biosynthesis